MSKYARAVDSTASIIFGAVVALGGILLMAVPAANADEILTYKGNDFTSVTGSYTTSDFISITIDLSTPLGNNLPFTSVTPNSVLASDGVQTISSPLPHLPPPLTGSSYMFQTGPTGTPISWAVDIADSITFGEIITLGTNIFNAPSGDFATIDRIGSSVNGFNVDLPGIWTTEITGVPGPSAGVGLPGLLMAACGFLWWRRHRRNPNATGPFAHGAAARSNSPSQDNRGATFHLGAFAYISSGDTPDGVLRLCS